MPRFPHRNDIQCRQMHRILLYIGRPIPSRMDCITKRNTESNMSRRNNVISTIFRALLTTIAVPNRFPLFPFLSRVSGIVGLSVSPHLLRPKMGGLPLQIQSSEVILRLKTAQFLTNIHVKAIHCTARKWRNSAVFANQAGSRQIVERLQGECGFRIENGRHKKGASDCQFTCALSDRVFGSVNLPGSTVEMGQKMLFMSGPSLHR